MPWCTLVMHSVYSTQDGNLLSYCWVSDNKTGQAQFQGLLLGNNNNINYYLGCYSNYIYKCGYNLYFIKNFLRFIYNFFNVGPLCSDIVSAFIFLLHTNIFYRLLCVEYF